MRYSYTSFVGLCEGSLFDAHYGWTGKYNQDESEVYYFRGFSNSLLSFDNDRSEWKLTLDSNSEVYATYNESINYPFDRQSKGEVMYAMTL